MPERLPPPQIRDVDLAEEPLKLSQDSISDAYALKLVNDTFAFYESWRSQNIDWRWKIHDQLYCGLVPTKVWEGTNIARANIPVPYTFTQVETAMPQLMEALFGFDDWFSVTPEPGGGLAEARAVQAHLKYNLEHSRYDYQTCETEIENSIRQMLIYGNGGVMLEWDPLMERVNVLSIDIRDIYLDNATPSANIDEARSLVLRRLMTVEEIKALASDRRMKIPSTPILVYMSENRQNVLADSTKRNQEAARKIQFSPGFHDWLPLPADKYIEVLIYYDKGRIIWVLNREWVAFDGPNPFGFLPFCIAPCFTFPFRFYGISFGDQLEGPQNFAQSLQNGYLDSLSLNMFPPRFVKRSGGPQNPSRMRWRPGLVIETMGDVQKDAAVQYPQNMNNDIMTQIAFCQQLGENVTGVNSMSQGVPRPGNVNRTATGVNSQLGATTNRMQLLVRHIEDFLISPMLYKMYRMIQLNAKPDSLLPALGQNDEYFTVGSDSFKSPIRFRMNASSRMMNRDKLQQALPIVEQALFQPQVMQNLNTLGYTVDPLEFIMMLQDATGASRAYNLIRQLTPEEQQQRMQPPPEVQSQEKLAQMDQQTRLQLGQMKQQTEQQKAASISDWQQHRTEEESARHVLQLIQQDKEATLSNNPQAQQQELQMKRAEAQMKLQHQAQKHQLDLQALQQKHKLGMQQDFQKTLQDAQLNRLDMQTQRQSAQNQMQIQRQQADQQAQIQREQANQKLQQGENSHVMALSQGQQKHKQTLSQAAEMSKVNTKLAGQTKPNNR